MPKIKVLLIGMSSNLGGIETYLYNLIEKADKTKFRFDILSCSEVPIAYEKELKEKNINIIYITPRTKSYKKHINELKEVLKKNKYDFMHYGVMTYSWCEPILVADKYAPNTKIIIHSHNAGYDKNAGIKQKFLHRLGRFRTRKVNYLKVACGEEAGKFMFPNEEFTVFNNGIDLEKFKYVDVYRDEIRKEFNISDDLKIIGLTARLNRQKNTLFLIDVMNELVKLDSSYRLVLVGEGELKQPVVEKCEEYNISDKVYLLGRRNDAYKIYSAYDVLVMPSLYEGLSITMIEAQANGLKCYTSDNVDVKTNITGNVEFLSLDLSAKEWAEKIYENNNARDLNVREKIPSEFDASKSYDFVYEYYMNNLK